MAHDWWNPDNCGCMEPGCRSARPQPPSIPVTAWRAVPHSIRAIDGGDDKVVPAGFTICRTRSDGTAEVHSADGRVPLVVQSRDAATAVAERLNTTRRREVAEMLHRGVSEM